MTFSGSTGIFVYACIKDALSACYGSHVCFNFSHAVESDLSCCSVHWHGQENDEHSGDVRVKVFTCAAQCVLQVLGLVVLAKTPNSLSTLRSRRCRRPLYQSEVHRWKKRCILLSMKDSHSLLKVYLVLLPNKGNHLVLLLTDSK